VKQIDDTVLKSVFRVGGRVIGNSGAFVRVFDRDLRNDQLLDASEIIGGRYEITYTAEQLARADKDSADLQVRVYDENDEELARSETRFNANADETIDVIVSPPSRDEGSEHERYMAELTPRLGGLPFDELMENAKHQDLSFLSGETGIPKERIGWLRDAERLKTRDLPSVVFYAWLRKGALRS
jgi:hypothetical protein